MKRFLIAALLAAALLSAPGTSQAASTNGGYICQIVNEKGKQLRLRMTAQYGCQGSFVGEYYVYDESAPATGRFTFKHDVFLRIWEQLLQNRWSFITFETEPNLQGLVGVGFTLDR